MAHRRLHHVDDLVNQLHVPSHIALGGVDSVGRVVSAEITVRLPKVFPTGAVVCLFSLRLGSADAAFTTVMFHIFHVGVLPSVVI